MLTPLNQIAAAIEVAFWDLLKEAPFPPHVSWIEGARTALEPLHYVQTVEDFYGIDKADIVVTNFLMAAVPWNGALATHLKRQLRNHLKDSNVPH